MKRDEGMGDNGQKLEKRWANRIVGTGMKPADQFQANPGNWRIHPERQRRAVEGSLNELGWIDTVIENAVTGNLIDGHERVWQALKNDNAEVPFIQVELTEAEEKLALAILDPITGMANTDKELLDDLLRQVKTGDAGLMDMLDTMAIREGIVPPPDPWEHWEGMPAFEHDDLTEDAAFTIRIFLQDEDELAELGRLIGKDLTDKKFVWFSKQPMGDTYHAIDGRGNES